ncbi:MAG: acyl-CoA thioesterase domain-containing protein [Pseudomonadota bacterium]
MTAKGVDKLVALLSPEQISDTHFRGMGSADDGAEATYGGHFLGQALAAGFGTVDDERHVHSLHAYFVRGGDPGKPIDYFVDVIRDGRTFAIRRVSAKQQDKILFELSASFCKIESGAEITADPPSDFSRLPAPESITPYTELLMQHQPMPLPEDWIKRDSGIDIRVVNAPWAAAGIGEQQSIRSWFKLAGEAPDNPHFHAAALAYQTDESLADILLVPFNRTWCSPGTFCVSLDHGLWFHEPIDVSNWHFIDQKALVAKNGRGVGNGYVWSMEGRLVASFTQEVLFRI